MKLKPIPLVAAAIGTAAAIGLGYGVAMWRMNAEMSAAVAEGASASASAATEGRKPLYWHDPMVPGPKFDKPGKSPFMDMQLVPVYGDTGGTDSGVSISPRAQQNLGVRTAEVVLGSLAQEIQAVGSVAWNERDVAVVPARASGFVEKLHVRAMLDPVARGQPLVDLYVPDWVAAQEEFLAVKRMGAMNSTPDSGLGDVVAAARQRMRLVGMTEEQIARVESRGVVQPRLTVTAPIGGVLAEIAVREGSAVTAGMLMARINGLSTVWVNAEVPEALAAQVRVGQSVQARTPAGISANGKVAAVLPEVNATTRTLKVRVELPNPRRQLLPGMFATLNFKPGELSGTRRDTLLIPSEAVIATGTRSVVMVAQDSGSFMPVEVETGVEANGQTEIRKGLTAGQRVVLSGQFLVDSEASLKGVQTRQGAASAPAAGAVGAARPGASFRGEGKVEAIGNGTVTLDHLPIPEARMGAMTMEYLAARGVVPRNVAVGDPVTFEFRKAADGQFELTSITPRADAPVVPKPSLTPAASGARP